MNPAPTSRANKPLNFQKYPPYTRKPETIKGTF